MAVNTTTPFALWRPDDGDDSDSLAGDGAAMHSMLTHDLVRGNNVMAARCQPCFQFAFDASISRSNAIGGAGSTLWRRVDSSIPSSGLAFLAQMPVVVPFGATRLITSTAIQRYAASAVEGDARNVDVLEINLFLSTNPIPLLSPSAQFPVAFPAHPYEVLGNFTASSIYRYTRHDIDTLATASGGTGYTLVVDPDGWDGFESPIGNGAVAWLIVGCTYLNATVGEMIYLRDFSMWAEYERSSRFTVLYDDAKLIDCRNGAPASGRVVKDLMGGFVKNASRPRPIYNCWGGGDAINNTILLRQNWLNVSPASPGLSTAFLTLPSTGEPDSAQGVALEVGSIYAGTSFDPPVTWDDRNLMRYPLNSRITTSQKVPVAEIISSIPTKGNPFEVGIGSDTINGPQVRSCLVYEEENTRPAHFPTDLPPAPYDNWLTPGSQIVGTEINDFRVRSVRGVRDYVRRVFKASRIAFGWSGVLDGTSGWQTINANVFRYILDTSVGAGGTAPIVTGPAITLPLRYTASGIGTRVRLYFSVYARQTGGGTGTLATYNRLDDESMATVATPMVNGPSITSSTWQWYGLSTPFNEASDTYFLGNAFLSYDRILPCAKTTAGTLDIGAFSIAAFHSAL